MTPLDKLLIAADGALRTLSGNSRAARAMPGAAHEEPVLTEPERRLSGALMRVNHVGEVCAQALYTAQALGTRDPSLRRQLEHSAREETDHLAWTRQRLDALGSHPSLLNPLWYAGATAIGLIASRLGDAVSLGFVVETERQVESHLEAHLGRMPPADSASIAVVRQMKDDEARHGALAQASGAAELPLPVKWAMRAAAKVMTTTAHYI